MGAMGEEVPAAGVGGWVPAWQVGTGTEEEGVQQRQKQVRAVVGRTCLTAQVRAGRGWLELTRQATEALRALPTRGCGNNARLWVGGSSCAFWFSSKAPPSPSPTARAFAIANARALGNLWRGDR